MTTTDYDDGNNRKVGGPDIRHVTTAMHNDKRQAWPPTDHFKRLLKEACPNHVYPIRHKLKDYDMMKSFMISGSPTWGMGLNEDLGGNDVMPFHEENIVMMLYDGRQPPPPYQGGVACLS
jgi:hypothetical protein